MAGPDLGGDDTIRPVLRLLDELDHYNRRLIVGKVFIITSNPAGGNVIRLALTRLGYDFERLFTLRGVMTAHRAVEDRDATGHSTGEQP